MKIIIVITAPIWWPLNILGYTLNFWRIMFIAGWYEAEHYALELKSKNEGK